MPLSLDNSADDAPLHGDMPQAEQFVRQDPASLSDEALGDYINGCAERFLASQRRYEETGSFADAGERDRWWGAEAEALRERGSRVRIVARMERERGLSGR
jgi:hypothetical protein